MRKKKIKDKKIMNILSNQKGMALLTTLIFVFILVTFSVSLLIMTSNDTKLSALQRDSTKAFYIAEAGIERTLYNLKKDFENSEDWNDQDNPDDPNYREIHGYPLTYEDENGFRKIEYIAGYDVEFGDGGDGTYTVALKINSSNYVTIKSKGKYDNSIRYVQVDVKIESLSIWGNGIFGGSGASGSAISGNVDIRGSVHILGEGLSPADIAIEITGTAGIGNNYIGMDSNLRSRVIDPPTNELGDQTLNAKLRVKNGKVNISGTATVGEPDILGNGYKETMDGVYVTDRFGGNQGESNVYSDNGTDQLYDLGEGTLEFPTLDYYYIDITTGETVENPDNNNEPYTYKEYYNSDNVYHIIDNDEVIKVSSITSETESFTIPLDAPGSYANYIIWDQAGALTISGIIVIDVNVSIGDKQKDPLNYIYEYEGTGTIVSKVDISIHGDLLANANGLFPTNNSLGLVAYNNINLATGDGDSQLKMMGSFYAENKITSAKQSEVVGTFVSNYFYMGNEVPSIYQVPELINNMPPGMPGTGVSYYLYTNNWHETHE